jgi:tRNA modification GTPase
MIAVDGWPVELADTAGLRADTGEVEQRGIGLARAAALSADLCLWLLDASARPVWPDFQAESLRWVVNKVDLPATWDLDQATDAIRVSALTSYGLDALCSALSGWLVPIAPPPGVAVPFTPNLCARMEESWRCCSSRDADGAKLALLTALQEIERTGSV